jgi:hypothetical protein
MSWFGWVWKSDRWARACTDDMPEACARRLEAQRALKRLPGNFIAITAAPAPPGWDPRGAPGDVRYLRRGDRGQREPS